MTEVDLLADLEELARLKSLATRPWVVQALEKLIAERKVDTSSDIREPIEKRKAKAQTLYITTGYGWDQTDQFVRIYLTIKNAGKLNAEQCKLNVEAGSVQLDITEHEGANYNFCITQLFAQVDPVNSKFKIKESRVVVYLAKKDHGKQWSDLRRKTTRDIYNELQRAEEKGEPLSAASDDPYGPTLEDTAKELYRNSDPETQRQIQKAVAEAQQSLKANRLNPFAAPGSSKCDHNH